MNLRQVTPDDPFIPIIGHNSSIPIRRHTFYIMDALTNHCIHAGSFTSDVPRWSWVCEVVAGEFGCEPEEVKQSADKITVRGVAVAYICD